MKLQKLTIHNIASIEDAVIEFDAHPLAGSEVFLISGKTGAGKSTILDAICLALFADTPRFDNNKTQGDATEGTDTFKPGDPRQIMRRNTGEAFASLTFKGRNGVNYEATWSVARAHKKVTGKLQSKKWELKNLDTGNCLTKDNEIEKEIEAAIGLKFDQFCRTTLLAQGEFTRFLNSNDNDKAEILEKITGVDIYAKIGKKIYEITAEKKKLWEDAKNKLEAQTTLSDDEVASLNKELTELEHQLDELKKLVDADTAKQLWLTDFDKLTRQLDEARKKLKEAQAQMDTDEFRATSERVGLWQKTIEARASRNEIAAAKHKAQQQEAVLSAQKEAFTELLRGIAFLEESISKLKAESERIAKELDAESDKATTFENSGVISTLLDNIARGRSQIDEKSKKKAADAKRLDEVLIPEWQRAERERAEQESAVKAGEENLKTLEDKVSQLGLPQLRQQIDGEKELQRHIDTAGERLEQLNEAIKRVQEERDHIAQLQRDIKQKEDEITLLKPELEKAKRQQEESEQKLQKQRASVNKFAKQIRHTLHQGDICPVCGQAVHAELPLDDELAKLCQILEDDFNAAKKAAEELAARHSKLEVERDTLAGDIKLKSEALDADKSVETARAQLEQACNACGVEPTEEHLPQRLADAKHKSERALEDLKNTLSEGEKLDNEARDKRKELDDARAKLKQLSDTQSDKQKAKETCESDIKNAEEAIKQILADIATIEGKIAQLVAGTWQTDWRQDPAAFNSELKTATEAHNARSERHKEIADKIERFTNTRQQTRDIVENRILIAMPDWRSIKPESPLESDNLFGKASEVSVKVSTAISLREEAEKSLEEQLKRLKEFLAQNPRISESILDELNRIDAKEIENMRAANDRISKAVDSNKALLHEADTRLNEHRQNKPAMGDDDSLESISKRITANKAESANANQRKGAITQQLNANNMVIQRLGQLCAKVALLKEEYDTWERLNKLFGSDKFRKIALSYVLAHLIRAANAYMQKLTDRYTLKVTPGSYLISIEDAYQGYATRSAGTASGGESFLVSLALALALSDIGRERQLTVDTLFIDEGFGSLSGEPLQNAIATLRSLHSVTGRHVGIISHIEELRERIPTQIQVIQDGHSSSSRIQVMTL